MLGVVVLIQDVSTTIHKHNHDLTPHPSPPLIEQEQENEEEEEQEVVDERFEPVLAPANIAPPEPLHGEEEQRQDELRLLDLSARARESESAKSVSPG